MAAEDYDAAKALKAEIARVRSAAGAPGARRASLASQGSGEGAVRGTGLGTALPGDAAASVFGGAASPVSPGAPGSSGQQGRMRLSRPCLHQPRV